MGREGGKAERGAALPGIGSQGSGMADRALQPVGCAGAALPVRPSARPGRPALLGAAVALLLRYALPCLGVVGLQSLICSAR